MTSIFIIALVAWVAISAADTVLSIKIQKEGGVERNPILPAHPSKAVFVLYGLFGTIAFAAVAYWVVIPDAGDTVAAFFLTVGSVLRAFVVKHNADQLK